MIIGIDFDNTLVAYDALFHRVAVERSLIPAGVPAAKNEVRDYLRRAGAENVWTEMQGLVYGARMSEAQPYPGALEFIRRCRAAAVDVRIISHKTRRPFAGPAYDLHAAAAAWLEQQGLVGAGDSPLSRADVFFEETKRGKIDRIVAERCTHFVDDLPEILSDEGFPAGTVRFLFCPEGAPPRPCGPWAVLTSWDEAAAAILPGVGVRP